jgi:ferredoxin
VKKEAVAVDAVERFAGDYAIERGLKFSRTRELPQSVAVTSVGPAGLSAACHLARRGYRVVMFDGSAPLGGILRSNVPEEILGAEIQRVLDLGVEVQLARGEDSVEKLRETHSVVVETAALEADDPSAVATAIAGGIRAAEDADAQTRGIVPSPPAPKTVVPVERMRPEWFKDLPRIDAAAGLTIDGIVLESRRCMSCGMCMGCGNCWSYCTKSGFERVPSGRRFKLKLERCNGCGKCSDGCPSGYIDMA